MKQCTACDRHLFGPEPTCPFCGCEQRTISAGHAGVASSVLASITLAIGLGMIACGPQAGVPVDEDTSSSTDPLPPVTTTTGATMSSATAITTMVEEGTTSTTLSSSTDSGDDFPCAFYACQPDIGDTNECDLFTQDCPEGEKCAPRLEQPSGTRCIPIADNPGAAGDACTRMEEFDDCDLGLYCWVHYVDGVSEGTCITQCGGTIEAPTCPEAGQVCTITNDALLNFCLDGCDPVLGDCPETFGCYAVGAPAEFACFYTALPGAYGDPCGFINDCDPGFTCLGTDVFPGPTCAAEERCCSPFCDLMGPEDCPEAMLGVICQPWFEPGTAPPGFEHVGACALPT